MSRKGLIGLWRLVFKQAKARAVRIAKNSGELPLVIEQAATKMDRHKGSLNEILDDLKLISRLLKAWVRGDYREISTDTIILLIAAIIYFLMPIDAIIDAVPVIGYADDITVIGFVLASAKAEIDKFRVWEKSEPGDVGGSGAYS